MAKAADLGVESVLDVLNNVFGLTGIERGDEYDIACPNPAHPDRNPSTGVNLVTGYWNCFSCGVGGDLLALGERVLGVSKAQVADMFKPRSAEAMLSLVQRRLGAIQLPGKRSSSRPLALPGPYEDGPLDELLERDFTPATLAKWGIRFVPTQTLVGKNGEFTIRESIAIPIRDEVGRLVAWCYRRTAASPSWQPRYLYTPDFPISEVWWGLQHNHPGAVRDINIGEGALDGAWLDQCGFPALAMLGSKMGDRKIRRLQSYRSVTLFADRDNAGAQWIKRVGGALGRVMPLYVVLYDRRITRTYVDDNDPNPKKRKIDPQMLMPIDVELLHARRVTWQTFMLRSA